MVVFDSRRRRSAISLLLAIVMVLSLFPAFVGTAEAAQVVPEAVAITQSQSGTCTLASAAMMIRARMYLSGNSKWSSITEHDIRGDVWLEGAGIYYSWTYTTVGVIITGDHEDVSGLSESQLAAMLKRHPEGIEIHCVSVPHAVLITDYTNGVFYCFDPAQHFSGRRIPLTDSWLGEKLGSQSSILSSVTSYWYISSYSIQPNTTVPTPVPAAVPTEAPTGAPTSPARQLNVTQQPTNQIAKNGGKVTFTAGASGEEELTYQWQYSRDGETWHRSSAMGTTATCLVNATTIGTWYRCMITDASGRYVYTHAAQILSEQPPVITRQPEDASGPDGGTIAFSVKADGEKLNYQWQYSDNGGKKWTNVNAGSDSVSVTIHAKENGRLYRCIVTNASGLRTISQTARVVVSSSMKINQQPEDVNTKDGANVIFTVMAEGKGLGYQWEYSTDGGKTWKQAESESYFYHFAASVEQSGWLFRCIVTDETGAKVTSRAAALTISGLRFTVQPQDLKATPLQVVHFRAEAAGEPLHYQWQISSNGKAWYNVGTAKTLTMIATKTASGRLVRCVVTDGYGNYIISNPARLTVN